MRYIILSILIFVTLPVFAEECNRNVEISIYDNDIKLTVNNFEYISSTNTNKEDIKVITYQFYYIAGKLYTIDMLSINQLQAKVSDENISLITNDDGKSITMGSMKYSDKNSYNQKLLFNLNIYVSVNEDCTLTFVTELAYIQEPDIKGLSLSSISKYFRMHNDKKF